MSPLAKSALITSMLALCALIVRPSVSLAQSGGPTSLSPSDRAVMAPAPASQKKSLPREKNAEDRLHDVNKALKQAEGQHRELKKKATVLDNDIANLRQGMVAAARLVQEHEQRVSQLKTDLARVEQDLDLKENDLRARRRQMANVLLALQRVAQYPPEALIAQPVSPGDTVRSAILLRATMPVLSQHARVLRDDLADLEISKADAERHRVALEAATRDLQGQRKQLRTMLVRKSRLRRRTVAKATQAERRVKGLAGEARSLRDLMRRLETLRQQREAETRRRTEENKNNNAGTSAQQPPAAYTGKPMDVAKGRLPYPVVGRVETKFGQTAESGLTHKGLTLDTVSEAQVIVPYEGRVAFTGPFRGYGRLLIIEHGAGYHTLIAGMGRIDVVVGQWVLSGEPVGIMDRVRSDQKGLNPKLYLEFRRGGQPINPLPWLVARDRNNSKSKVSG